MFARVISHLGRWLPPRRRVAVSLLGLLLAWNAFPGAVDAQSAPFDLHAALAAAQPGATINVPAGVYPGPFAIDRPVVLEGAPGAILDGGNHGDVVTVTAPDVTIRGFTIRNSGDLLDRESAGVTGLAPRLTVENNLLEGTLFGIYLKNAPDSVIRGNRIFSKDLDVARRGDGIRAWYSDHPVVEDNHVTGSRDVVIWFSPHGEVRRNTVSGGRYGLHFMFSDDQIVEENVLRHNSVGAFLMYGHGLALRNNLMTDNRGPSGFGIGLKDVDNVEATGNRFVGNRVGLYVDNSPREPDATVHFSDNLIAYNEIGAALLPLVKRNSYSRNVFLDNGEQIAIVGGGELSGNAWAPDGQGNYWSDYAGFDADGDARGDINYAPQSLYENLLELYPELRLFQMSPSSDALDLAARAFPLFQPQPKIVDEHPLMAVPALPPVPGIEPAAPWATMTAALALIGLAVGVLALGLTRRKRVAL